MSNHTVSSLPRITAPVVREFILASATQTTPSKLAIIDVRDDDHIGGHIKNSTHIPSNTINQARLNRLVTELKDKDTVIFHCALSQVRGPKAALGYLRAREAAFPESTSSVGKALKKNAEENKGLEMEEKEGEWEDMDGKEGKEEEEQKVFVLERGFVGWQESYGEDESLTTGYSKELWKEGYWM
ncbi:hypothetical protein B0O99DRAFT_618516 [Bisporella sp. PMI_857]|nr:hypothetical protein B0O99DRAFT_618516 [Bisporella sp. PMI_857]